MWLFLLFLAVPLIEIALFVQVGGAIGLWSTLAIVVATAVVGTLLVKTQGLNTIAKLQSSMREGGEPTEYLAHGMMIFFAGALLLTPGFFTDGVGFALLTPGIRRLVFRKLITKIQLHTVSSGPGFGHSRTGTHDSDIIDGEYQEFDPNATELDKPQN